MLFNSIEFFIFLPTVFALYWLLSKKSPTHQNLLLLFASYFFYGWWSWKFLILLAISTGLDYLYGFGVASANKKKAKTFLYLSILNNLGILGVFKYYNFFAVEFQNALGLIGIHVHPVFLQVALPIGISFYTFHGMSYVFDIYRRKRRPVTNFIEYAVFVCFFPLLVAGPIERASHLLPQVQTKRIFNYDQAVEGCRLILWGLFKKIVFADSLGIIVNGIFNNYLHQNAYTLILGAIGFSFQIYGDFSGYTDIALGTAKLFGFELFTNFKYPYFSRDIAEFWRRWHISLSSWFRDYLYIPLGGSRKGKKITIRNMFIVFLVSGFWHGANWNFIAWGGLHACAFLPLLLLNKNRQHLSHIVAEDRNLPTLKELLQMGCTFSFVTFAWIFFRSKSLPMAIAYIKRIVTNTIKYPDQYFSTPATITIMAYILPFVLIEWWLRRDERRLRTPAACRPLLYFVLAILIIFSFKKRTNFIYFQF